MNKFYVYVFLREDRQTPYYVGKGSGNRCYSQRERIVPSPSKDRIIILKENLTEEEAFELEITMIKFWGRLDNGTGVLRNRTRGGEGTVGVVRDKGDSSPFYDKPNCHGLGYVITSPTGDTTIVSGLHIFARNNNLCSVALHRVAKGIINKHKGWLVSYLDEHKKQEAETLREERRKHTSKVRSKICAESNRRRKGEKRNLANK